MGIRDDSKFAKTVYPGILELFQKEEETLQQRVQGLELKDRIALYKRLAYSGEFLLGIQQVCEQEPSSSDTKEPPSVEPDAPTASSSS